MNNRRATIFGFNNFSLIFVYFKVIISTALFYTITVMTIVSILAAAMAFPLEIPIIMREVLIFFKILSKSLYMLIF